MANDTAANVEISATTNKLGAALRKAAGMVNSFAGGVRDRMGRIGEGAVGSAIGNTIGGIANRGIDFLADQGKAVVDFERNLTRLGMAGSLSKGQIDALRTSARKTSSDFGVADSEILAGTQTYVDLTGDIAGASQAMSTFARVAQASGASVSDVSAAAAAFSDVGVGIGELEGIFGGMITQGKAGAVSLKDFAASLSSLLPRWNKFNEGTTNEGIAQLGAAFQVARKGFGSAAQAATGMEAMMGAIVNNAKKFEAAGVKVFDKNPKTGVKTLRTFEQIMSGIEKSKLVKDPTLMTKALGSKEAEQTVAMLLKARMAVDGQVSAYQALIEAGADAGAVQRDLTTYLESDAGRMDRAWNSVKVAIAEAFTPERIAAFANIVEGLAAKIGPVAEAAGFIADKLGGLVDVGKSIRGAFSEDANPYRAERTRKMLRNVGNMRNLGEQNVADVIRNARSDAYDKRNEEGFDRGTKIITAAERNERSTKESVRAAFALSNSKIDGEQIAGSLYLREGKIDKDKIRDEMVAELIAGNAKMTAELAKIAANTAKPAETRIGDNQIAKSNTSATSARRSP